MPPRTRSVLNGESPNQPVSNHLTKEYYSMIKSLGKSLECSICIEPIDCDKCICLLLCGHSFHYSCIMRVEPPIKCPLCRN